MVDFVFWREGEKVKTRKIGAVEFLVILGGIAVLGAIVVPNFVRSHSRDSIQACKSNLKNIGTALEMYSTDWGGKYPATLEVLSPNYLKIIPECPRAGKDTYSSSYSKSSLNSSEALVCPAHPGPKQTGACAEKRRKILEELKNLGEPELTAEVISRVDAVCPDGRAYSYPVFSEAYSFYCSGDNHDSANIPADYPKYNSVEGLILRP